jgi:hypothetical protein
MDRQTGTVRGGEGEGEREREKEGGDLKNLPFPPFMEENGLKWAERKHYRVDEKRRTLMQTDRESFT